MEAGIVGLPNVGKSTLFNALTQSKGAQSENYPFCTIEPNEGIITVPDSRLDRITEYITPQKVIPAVVKLVDIAGIVKGASEGEGLGNKFLSHIRAVDAILQVVRCFEDPDVIHVSGQVDPMADIETIGIELMLADIEMLQGAMDKAKRAARAGDKEAILRVEAINKCLAHLETESPLRNCELTEAEDNCSTWPTCLRTMSKALLIWPKRCVTTPVKSVPGLSVFAPASNPNWRRSNRLNVARC